ncbi:hypothetical protein CC85DRAFT_78855 [Cutaneotrichosporon oleaginosum]|uniref:Uncharacterized protein n=1 Tax=Cutaneotrichosporon oleaginosum TaxID=879819 RepID=A0A0J1B4Z8_9TREE|nr:uncharacterized protein CC85DRAFT_78855 [Cutaneotrichosporon oleaginosum]KLT42769.1 hypothetical protein CC85DRAFT_78855 [Cutaneotrichosporon oleaginosum]TXT09513.1 hypothetical protein COLE_03447 [Cutaneotrichosporon oleaginosum]
MRWLVAQALATTWEGKSSTESAKRVPDSRMLPSLAGGRSDERIDVPHQQHPEDRRATFECGMRSSADTAHCSTVQASAGDVCLAELASSGPYSRLPPRNAQGLRLHPAPFIHTQRA